MKQICTQIAFFCLLVTAQKLNAQNSVSISTSFPIPAPVPVFGIADSVSAANGFTSTSTGTFHNFPKNKTTTIVSPSYYYPTSQSTIYFIYNLGVATAGSATTRPVVSIIKANGDTVTATASVITFSGVGGLNYYFQFNLATPLSANTNFKISLKMAIDDDDKAVTAYTLTTNAIRGSAPAPAPVLLPVKFSGFYAKKLNNSVSLVWNVAEEMNVHGYEVQRSADGSNFSAIGFVTANNSPSYNFVDAKATEVAYYRIKSVDFDGKYIYSTVITVRGQQSSIVMKAFPMPVQSQLTLQHNAAGNDCKIDLITADGRVMKSITVAKGVQQTSLDFSFAKAGVYVVRFINDESTETLKVVKQ